MGNKRFLTPLARELPDWVRTAGCRPAPSAPFSKHVAAQRGGTPLLACAFSILGVPLFGSGIITCFVSNWGKIPKLISDPEYFVEMPQT